MLPNREALLLLLSALLNCYFEELMTNKAGAVVERMKELNFASTAIYVLQQLNDAIH
jgi:pentatricopeptide repeat protein